MLAGDTRFLTCTKCKQVYVVVSETERASAQSGRRPAAAAKELPIPPTPKEIHGYLDKYVIGQDYAKKILATAVYNHYKRISACPIPAPAVQPPAPGHADLLNPGAPPAPFLATTGGPPPLSAQPPPTHFSANDDFRNDGYGQRHRIIVDSKVGGYPSFADQGQSDQQQQPPPTRKTAAQVIASDTNELKLEKSNIVLLGPTGVGKTHLAQVVATFLDVPFAMCDCTSLTMAGYVGEDVESVISRLLQNAKYDVEKAQQGIVFLDEVDKIGSVPGVHQLRDVGGEGVQQALLKLVEGSVVNAPTPGNRRARNPSESIQVDTTNILFVASGAFTGLDKVVARRMNESYIGFDSGPPEGEKGPGRRAVAQEAAAQGDSGDVAADAAEADAHLRHVQARDLIDFGLIPEFVGRFPIIGPLHSLSRHASFTLLSFRHIHRFLRDMLVRILTEPRNSLVAQKKALFKMDKVRGTGRRGSGVSGDGIQVDLHFDEEALGAVADASLERKTGARGLKSIVEEALLEPNYEAASISSLGPSRGARDAVGRCRGRT